MAEPAHGFRTLPPERRLRFGPFEADSRSGELRKHGIKVRLGQQTFQILMMLLDHPGEVVLREEIRLKLWPHDTVVEFDHSINAAIQKLRDALGESAVNPRYIETLPRRGYRFIGTVEPAEPEPAPEPLPGLVMEPAGEIRPKRVQSWLIVAALLLLAGLSALAALRPWGARATPRRWTFSMGAIGQAVLAPDGSAVIYSSPGGLVLRRMDSLTETPLFTEERISGRPVWSPDGSQVLFNRYSGGLYRLPLPAGPPSLLWRSDTATRGFDWSADGNILMSKFEPTPGVGGLFLLPAKGGDLARVDLPGFTGGMFYQPEFLPDGKNILFGWEGENDLDVGLYLATLEHGRITRGPVLLRRNMTSGRYAPSGGGRLLFVEDDKLYAQKLDIRKQALDGPPEQILEGVFTEPSLHRAQFSVSRNGVLLWRAGRAGVAQLTWFDRTGAVTGTAGPLCLPGLARVSPDGKYVLLYAVPFNTGLSIASADHSGFVALSGITESVLWMPGSRLLFSRKKGSTHLLIERAAEGGPEKERARVDGLGSLQDVSPDGKVLLYRGPQGLCALRLDDQAATSRTVAPSMTGRFSPDGRFVTYSNLTGNRSEIFVQPFPSGLPTQLTTNGGTDPIWRGDEKEIIYRNGSTIYSVPVEVKANRVHAGAPKALFSVRVPAGLAVSDSIMAVTHDGSRILFTQGVDQPDPQLTYVMTNWDANLRR